MIFCSRNEKGEDAWRLVLDDKKTVTRRLKPLEKGKIVAVQPNRGKKAVGYIKIKHCCTHYYWDELFPRNITDLNKEAEREGFGSWLSLLEWFQDNHIRIEDTFRIEFELVKP